MAMGAIVKGESGSDGDAVWAGDAILDAAYAAGARRRSSTRTFV
jgi:hypothetical protein